MTGDATLFHRADIVEAGWELVAPVMAAWQAGGPPVRNYAAGSWGPPEADALIARDGRAWRDPLRNARTSPLRLPRKVRSP